MLRLNSIPGNIAKVENLVDDVVSQYRLSMEQKGSILISLTEAVTNAMRHGNSNDANKAVEVSHDRRNGHLSFSISDEGQGFDYNNLPDPTAPENILKCGGRGVFLMRQLADELEFRNNGSTVEMRFNI